MSHPINQELLDNYKDDFEIALEQGDQQKAEAVIELVRALGYESDVEFLEETLQGQDWYCDECGGTKEVTVQEYDADSNNYQPTGTGVCTNCMKDEEDEPADE